MDLEDDNASLHSGVSPTEASSSNDSSSSTTSRKRRHHHQHHSTPLTPAPKRPRGPFNPQYLTLLNTDITDAASGIVQEDYPFPTTTTSNSTQTPFPPSQLGAVTWSTTEKRSFFAALARLGRDDIPGMASRIGGSKSEPEVRQYLSLLATASRARQRDEGKRRRTVRAVDVPAAVEVGAELGRALEGAADAVAARVEAHEAGVEARRWGEGWWVVSRHTLRQHQQEGGGEGGGEKGEPPFADLFALPTWLRLSERVFMNSSILENNWRHVSSPSPLPAPPAIRATALADFHALTVSVTRRLVAAALFVAESRIRARRGAGESRGRVRDIVKARDVRAAVASVGMRGDAREWWARAPRRLRLDVFAGSDGGNRGEESAVDDEADDLSVVGGEEDDDTGSDWGEGEDEEDEDYVGTDMDEEEAQEDESEPDILPYSEVEALLGLQTTHSLPQSPIPTTSLPTTPIISSPSSTDSEQSYQDEEDTHMSDTSSTSLGPAGVDQDLTEALTYSSLNYTGTARAREALRRRIEAEHRAEAEAEAFDARASVREEARLWGVLRGEGYHGGGGGGEMAEEKRRAESKTRGRSGVADVGGPDWRDCVGYRSEWEFVYSPR
ncbi:hypothetical protein F5B20DRAFT_594998 [Whalleya microplaca]|nr:hypothetical protein F5B20DRAFT_594998 [Whalleya microplaca]